MVAAMKLRIGCPHRGRRAPTRAGGLRLTGCLTNADTGHERPNCGAADQWGTPWVPFGVQAKGGQRRPRKTRKFFQLKIPFQFRNPIIGPDLNRSHS